MRKPNILWIMTDQQRYDAAGPFGRQEVQTPNLNSLAEEGVCFDQHYSCCPLCVPARGSLATGRYPHATGSTVNAIFWPDKGEIEHATLNPNEVTLGERLIDAGYIVGQVGIDHVITDPRNRQRQKFHYFYNLNDYGAASRDKNLPGYNMADHQVVCEVSTKSHRWRGPFSGPQPGCHPIAREDFIDFVFADEAVGFLDGIPENEAQQPWALFVYLWAPHPPLVWPEPYCRMYDPGQINLPPNVGRRGQGQSRLHDVDCAGQLGRSVPTREEWKTTWAAYWGGCTLADDAIGRVLKRARDRPDWDNTIVLFHPDHGEQLGAHNCYQKMVCYQESIHVPLIIRVPGVPPGRRNTLTSHVDIAPTLLDYAGIKLPPQMHGCSLRPFMNDPGWKPNRQAVFSEYNGNMGWNYFQRCVITDQWKYIHNFGVDNELYNLYEDPFEMHNRITDVSPSLNRQLHVTLRHWQEETDDFLRNLSE